MPQSAELPHPTISDPGRAQRRRQCIACELRIGARLRHGAYIDERLHTVRLQHLDELLDRPRGMSDSEQPDHRTATAE
jgi:hypothetical protein